MPEIFAHITASSVATLVLRIAGTCFPLYHLFLAVRAARRLTDWSDAAEARSMWLYLGVTCAAIAIIGAAIWVR